MSTKIDLDPDEEYMDRSVWMDRARYLKIQQYILCGLVSDLFPEDIALQCCDERRMMTTQDFNKHIDQLPEVKYE